MKFTRRTKDTSLHKFSRHRFAPRNDIACLCLASPTSDLLARPHHGNHGHWSRHSEPFQRSLWSPTASVDCFHQYFPSSLALVPEWTIRACFQHAEFGRQTNVLRREPRRQRDAEQLLSVGEALPSAQKSSTSTSRKSRSKAPTLFHWEPGSRKGTDPTAHSTMFKLSLGFLLGFCCLSRGRHHVSFCNVFVRVCSLDV